MDFGESNLICLKNDLNLWENLAYNRFNKHYERGNRRAISMIEARVSNKITFYPFMNEKSFTIDEATESIRFLISKL